MHASNSFYLKRLVSLERYPNCIWAYLRNSSAIRREKTAQRYATLVVAMGATRYQEERMSNNK